MKKLTGSMLIALSLTLTSVMAECAHLEDQPRVALKS